MCYDCKQNTLLSENFRKFGKAALDMLYKCPLISTAWTKKMQIKTDTVSRHSSIFCYIQENKEECDTDYWCEGKYANKRYE